MDEEATPERLFVMLNEEKKTGELLPLPKNFYLQAGKRAATKSPDPKESENAERLLKNLKAKRVQKILVYLAYGRQLPQQIPVEEEALYSKLRKILNEESDSSKAIKIRMFSDVPEILAPSGKKVGPFKQNEIVEFGDESDTQFILNNKLGEII